MSAQSSSWRDAPDGFVLRAYANGDAEAARVLSIRLLPRVLAQATRMLSDQFEAEDVAQDAMMRLWKIAPEWREGEAQVSTWLYRVVANLCTDRLRKRRGVSLDQIAEPVDPQLSAPAQLQDNARLSALSGALAELPERQAQAVSLRHLEGLSNTQIAEIMDISIRSVESLTARGKRALADILGHQKQPWGMTMNKSNEDILDDLFKVASTQTPKVADHLMMRILMDADNVQPVPITAPKPSFLSGMFGIIGGWPSVGGLAMAGVTGLWFGVSPPSAVSSWTADLFGAPVTVDLFGDTSDYFVEVPING